MANTEKERELRKLILIKTEEKNRKLELKIIHHMNKNNQA